MANGPLDRDEIVAHAAFVRGVARGILADAAAADDVAQETLLRLLKAAPARALAPRSLKAWLVRAVRNLAIQWRLADVRRATREGGSAQRETAPATDALVQRMELHRRVVDAALALDEGQRAVVLLHYFDGASMAEVAQRLGVPLETARTRLKRALERLRARLEAEAGGSKSLLLALLPVAGWELPSAAVVATSGGLVAGTLVTSIGAPLVMTTVGKLSLAAASVLAVSAWWMLHRESIDAEHATASAVAVAPPASLAAGVEHAAATRSADASTATAATMPATDATPAAEEVGTVRVHVVAGAERAAAANVGVRVVPEAETRSIAKAVRGSTGADGLFVAERVPAGTCVAAFAGFDALNYATKVELKPGATCDVELPLPEAIRVDGLVVDEGDRPIAGASIWLSDCESTVLHGEDGAVNGSRFTTSVNGQVVTKSDAEGRFELRSVCMCTGISAFAPGRALSQSHALFSLHDGRHPLTIRLTRAGATVTGRVVTADGKPIADAIVTCDVEKQPARELRDGILLGDLAPRRERSGSDGRFTLEGAPFAPARLIVAAAGFSPSVAAITPAPAVVNDFTVVLDDGGAIAGTIHDDAGGAIGDVEIEVTPIDYALWQDLDVVRTRSGDHGEFRIGHLFAGPLRASIADPRRGRATADFTVAAGETHAWNVVLSRGRVVRGRVVDERGAPLAAWVVVATARDGRSPQANRIETTSGADGRFELADCDDVEYEVTLHPEANSFALGVKARARPGDGELLLQVRDADLPRSWIFGSLRVPDGFPTADALLDVRQLDGPGATAAMVGQTPGRFQAGGFPAGRYALSLRISRLPTRDLGIRELRAGEELDLGEIVFERPACVVVRARHADGSAVDAKELFVASRDTPDRIELTGAGANLEAAPLDPGRYVLCCDPSSANFVAQPFECAAGQQVELAVTLEPAALRTFRFTARAAANGSAARPPDRVTVRCFDEAGAELWARSIAPDARGALELRVRFAAGHWNLEATAGDGSRADFAVDVESLNDEAAAREIALR